MVTRFDKDGQAMGVFPTATRFSRTHVEYMSGKHRACVYVDTMAGEYIDDPANPLPPEPPEPPAAPNDADELIQLIEGGAYDAAET